MNLTMNTPLRVQATARKTKNQSKFSPHHVSLYDIDLNCKTVLSENATDGFDELKKWEFRPRIIEDLLLSSENICESIKTIFDFLPRPLSEEETNFPLAYGIVVHRDIIQVLLMLSSFYHPQNEYCIAVSGSATSVFRSIIEKLPKCFQNIHVQFRPPIFWGGFEIINSTFSCLQFLSKSSTPWRYFQYLSGVDVPLKTNLEMIRIFKSWNGTPNIDFVPFERDRLWGKKPSAFALPLIKSTLSAAIARETANAIVSSSRSRELLRFLDGTFIPDESFWATLLGNRKKFPLPGAFDAHQLMAYRRQLWNERRSEVETYFSRLDQPDSRKENYFLARIQYWNPPQCKGRMVSGSCVFGVAALPSLLRQPHLIAHKLYLNYEPAAFFCAIKEIRRRSLSAAPFDVSFYKMIPLVELNNGIPLQNLTNPFALFSIFGDHRTLF